jgi:hypothetical protein
MNALPVHPGDLKLVRETLAVIHPLPWSFIPAPRLAKPNFVIIADSNGAPVDLGNPDAFKVVAPLIIATMNGCADIKAPEATVPALVETLNALSSTARTFRDVPKEDQEWVSSDDAALDSAFHWLAFTNKDEDL